MKVHDVKRERIKILGWEIDERGELHVAKDKFQDKFNVIYKACSKLALAPDVIEGASRYAGGAPVHFVDESDIQRIIDATYRSWTVGNPREAERFLREANKLLVSTPVGDSSGRARVWRCALAPTDRNRRGEGHRPRGDTFRGHVDGIYEIKEPKARRAEATNDEVLEELLDDGTSFTGADWDSILSGGGVSEVCSDPLGAEPMAEERTGRWSEGDGDPVLSTVHLLDSDDVGKTFRLRPPAGPPRSRVDGDPGVGEPSASPVFDKTFVGWRWCRKKQHTVVAAAPDGDDDAEPALWVIPHVRPEVALVRWLRREIVRMAENGARLMEFLMTDPWLPKHMLQSGREFHAPILFREVLLLHAAVDELGLDVVISGGHSLPRSFNELVTATFPSLGGRR